MVMEARKIVNEFGSYVGVAVVEIDLVMQSFEDDPEPGTVEERTIVPVIKVIRHWTTHDEEYAFGLAEGFIEGRETSSRGGGMPLLNCSSVGEFNDVWDDVSQKWVENAVVTSPPPWEQGYTYDYAKRGFVATAHGHEKFIAWSEDNLDAYHTWELAQA